VPCHDEINLRSCETFFRVSSRVRSHFSLGPNPQMAALLDRVIQSMNAFFVHHAVPSFSVLNWSACSGVCAWPVGLTFGCIVGPTQHVCPLRSHADLHSHMQHARGAKHSLVAHITFANDLRSFLDDLEALHVDVTAHERLCMSLIPVSRSTQGLIRIVDPQPRGGPGDLHLLRHPSKGSGAWRDQRC
jgi:hypothetical protein